MDVTVRFRLVEREITAPEFETTGPFTPSGADEPAHATVGISDDC